MSQISVSDASDLLSKLLSERISLRAFFVGSDGTRFDLPGFIDSVTRDNGLSISTSGPPIDVNKGYIAVPYFGRSFTVWYGERRELSEELLARLNDNHESVLWFQFDTGEKLALFFTF